MCNCFVVTVSGLAHSICVKSLDLISLPVSHLVIGLFLHFYCLSQGMDQSWEFLKGTPIKILFLGREKIRQVRMETMVLFS